MKLLSLILAVMMIAGMIPISAVAAPAAGKIGMTLKTGQVDDAFLDYGELSQANADNSVGTAAETVADAQTKMQSVEAKFTADSKAEYGEGEPFYLAIDLDTTNLSQIYTGATGIRSLQLAIELPDGVELVNDYTGAGQIVANPTLTGKVANGRVVTAVPALAEYVGDTTASAATKTDRGKNYLIVTAQIRAGNYLIPVLHTGWDFIVALKVSTGATSGSKTIKLEPNLLSDGGGTGVVYSTNPNGQAPNANNVNNADIDCQGASLKVTGPGIELKGTPKVLNKAGQKVTVTPSSVTPGTTGWSIRESTATDNTGDIAATAKANGTDFDISFDGSTLNTAKKYVVVYNNSGTDLKTGEFSVTPALTGTAKITGTAKVGETLTAALDGGPAGATLKYQWTAGGTSISGATSATYTLTAAEAGKVINVVIAADGYDGTAKATDTAAVADGDAPSIAAKAVATAEYGADITAAIKSAFTGEPTGTTFTFSEVTNSILKVSGNTVKVGSGAIASGNNTVNVSIKRPGYEAASTTASLTAKTKKQLTLAATGTAGNNVEVNLPTPTGMITGDAAPIVTWTKNTESGCTATLNGTKITAALDNVANPGTVTLTAAITSDDYQLKTTGYTLTVTAAAMTNIVLDAAATTAGFTVSPASVVQGTSNNEITITPPTDYTIDSVTGTGVTWTSGNKFTLSTTEGQASVTVTITGHAAKTVTATITSKPYDGTVAIDKSDVTFNVDGVTFEKAEYEDANVGTNKVVTITGITWPDTTNEYTLADVKGDITAVTPASAAAAATAVANTNPTTANVIEAIKAAVITFTNADGKTFTMTVGSLLADATTDTVLESKIADAINGVAAFESTKAPDNTKTYDASVDGTAAATVNPGSVISVAEGKHIEGNVYTIDSQKDAASADVTYFSVDAATGTITIASDAPVGVYTVVIKGGEAVSAASEGMKEAANPVTITATITVEACGKEYKLENLAENATGEINLGNIYSLLDATKSPNLSGLPATIELSLDVTKSNTPAPGPSTSFKPYMEGYPDGTLLPGNSVTRAQFAKMLVIATGKFDETKKYEKPDYPDVIEGKWYVPYIACAVENKIMDGKEDGKMYPNKTITRQEAAKMIYVALGTTDEIKTTDKVKDFDSVQDWAKMYVATLVEKNIIKGFDDGTFKPKNNITRAQAAVMINRLLGFDPDKAERAKIAELTIEGQFKDVEPSGNWSYAHLMYAAGKLPDSYYAG